MNDDEIRDAAEEIADVVQRWFSTLMPSCPHPGTRVVAYGSPESWCGRCAFGTGFVRRWMSSTVCGACGRSVDPGSAATIHFAEPVIVDDKVVQDGAVVIVNVCPRCRTDIGLTERVVARVDCGPHLRIV